MGKRPKDPPPPAPPPRFHAPFEGLRARLGVPGAPVVPEPTAAAAEPPPAPAAKPGPARAVVRFERKGRGGKAVTVVEKLGLAPRELEAWLSDLKRALGCGGQVEGDSMVLQGDLRERVRAQLEARGVRRVTVS
jgi:translation initiation factor 1